MNLAVSRAGPKRILGWPLLRVTSSKGARLRPLSIMKGAAAVVSRARDFLVAYEMKHAYIFDENK